MFDGEFRDAGGFVLECQTDVTGVVLTWIIYPGPARASSSQSVTCQGSTVAQTPQDDTETMINPPARARRLRAQHPQTMPGLPGNDDVGLSPHPEAPVLINTVKLHNEK